MKKLKRSLFFQLGLTITLFIVLIEALLLAGSYRSRKRQFYQLRKQLSEEYKKTTGGEFKSAHPYVLSDQYIYREMMRFTRNITILVFIIIVVVVAGTLLFFYSICWRYIKILLDLVRDRKQMGLVRFPEKIIPRNEIGELILARESHINLIESYQKDIEGKLAQTRSELIHSAKLKAVGEFSASLVHDIKNPLSVIQMSVAIFKKKVEDQNAVDEKWKESIYQVFEKAERSIDKIEALGKRMMGFVRREEQERKSIDVKEAIVHSLDFVKPKIAKNKITVNYNFIDELPKLCGDKHTLEQLFMNLLDNACDAIVEKNAADKKIEITGELSVNKAGHEVVQIKISDNGKGMSEEIKQKIFSSFFTTKKEGQGTGLGLSNVKYIVEKFKGQIEVDSTPGQGSTFILHFPMEEELERAA